MSFKNCIDNAEREGAISKERADELRRQYAENYRQLEIDYGVEAGAEAARRTFDAAKFEALERRRRKLLQAKVGSALSKKQAAFRNLKGEADQGEFMVSLIEDVAGKLGDQSSVNARYKAIKGRAHARMQGVIEAFERDVLTRTRNKPLLREVVRGAFGDKNISPEARNLVDAWTEAAEFLRRRFNAAGGHIGRLENWGLPQSHDAVAVRRAGYRSWRAEVLPRLDRARMIDERTGRPFTDEKLELALREVFETISTEGANKISPSGAAAGRAVANRRADHRFLIFKDGDGWLAYQQRFGNRDAFAAMTGHIDALSREIAGMEILGPNPNATLRLLEQNARKAAGLAGERGVPSKAPLGGTPRKIWEAWNVWGLFTGSANAPVNAFAARALSSTRNALTGAQLGTAWFSAWTDQWLGAAARHFNGLPAARQLGQVVNFMLPTSRAETADAVRAGLIADGATQVGLAQARYLGEINTTGITARMADVTLRASLLSPWTQAGRWAFGMEFLGGLASRAGKSIHDLRAGGGGDKAFARALDRYGLAGAWDEIRSTPAYEPEKGAMFIRPEDIVAREDLPPSRADFIANRLLEMIQTETEYAVPTASLRARSALTAGSRSGSFAGEVLRSTAMYKSFPTTLAYIIGSRAMAESARVHSGVGLGFAASVAVGMALFGGIVLQARELKAGRDPRDMTDARFWQAAMLQGGGLGIFGDFAFGDVNRFGGGLPTTFAGPVIGLAQDVRELTFGNMQQAVRGEDARLGRDGVRFLRRYTPGGNIWYAELAYQRLILDELQRWSDPDADEYARRQIRNRERQYGNSYFWAPGERLPSRPPALESAIGADVE